MPLYFWLIMWMKNVNNFQIAKVAWQLLNFCQFNPGVAYKSTAYIKKHVLDGCFSNMSFTFWFSLDLALKALYIFAFCLLSSFCSHFIIKIFTNCLFFFLFTSMQFLFGFILRFYQIVCFLFWLFLCNSSEVSSPSFYKLFSFFPSCFTYFLFDLVSSCRFSQIVCFLFWFTFTQFIFHFIT